MHHRHGAATNPVAYPAATNPVDMHLLMPGYPKFQIVDVDAGRVATDGAGSQSATATAPL